HAVGLEVGHGPLDIGVALADQRLQAGDDRVQVALALLGRGHVVAAAVGVRHLVPPRCWRSVAACQPRVPKRAASKLAAPRLVLELSAISVSPWTKAVSIPDTPPRMADSDESRPAGISSERSLKAPKAAYP